MSKIQFNSKKFNNNNNNNNYILLIQITKLIIIKFIKITNEFSKYF